MSIISPTWLEPLRLLSDELGFCRFAIAPVVDSGGFSDLVRWIDSGYAAGMDYFENRKDAYQKPTGVMPGAKSIVVLGFPYPQDSPEPLPVGYGRVARYAWPGQDYHDVIHGKLKQMRRLITAEAPETRVRGCVDTAPLLERELAQLCGVGWRGKNTLILDREIGSYFFLACLLVDVELPYDPPHEKSYCGSCTACLEVCPTDAFVGPGVLDARRCISYLTIEHRGLIDHAFREGIGDWLFGCDLCQEVCPWNRKPARRADNLAVQHPLKFVELSKWFDLDEASFRAQFRKTPFWRTRLNGMQRNAAIVMGNAGDPDALPALRKGAALEDETVREACEWAIAKILDGATSDR